MRPRQRWRADNCATTRRRAGLRRLRQRALRVVDAMTGASGTSPFRASRVVSVERAHAHLRQHPDAADLGRRSRKQAVSRLERPAARFPDGARRAAGASSCRAPHRVLLSTTSTRVARRQAPIGGDSDDLSTTARASASMSAAKAGRRLRQDPDITYSRERETAPRAAPALVPEDGDCSGRPREGAPPQRARVQLSEPAEATGFGAATSRSSGVTRIKQLRVPSTAPSQSRRSACLPTSPIYCRPAAERLSPKLIESHYENNYAARCGV